MADQCYWWSSMISVCFVVEGDTEEQFIHNALIPYLKSKTTRQINYTVINLNGGILYSRLISMLNNVSPQYDLVTTIFDLVALDAAKIDNYSNIMKDNNLSPQDKATKVESNITKMVNHTNIIPYIQPHEFEALCFGDIDGLAKSDPLLFKHKSRIEQVLKVNNHAPENINTIPSSYPAKRLEKFGYSKSSTNFAQYCNIDTIKSCCPHFDSWLTILIKMFR